MKKDERERGRHILTARSFGTLIWSPPRILFSFFFPSEKSILDNFHRSFASCNFFGTRLNDYNCAKKCDFFFFGNVEISSITKNWPGTRRAVESDSRISVSTRRRVSGAARQNLGTGSPMNFVKRNSWEAPRRFAPRNGSSSNQS